MCTLTDAQVAHYRDLGWVAPVDVMSAVEAAELLGMLEAAGSASSASRYANRLD